MPNLLVTLPVLRTVARRPGISADPQTVDGAFAAWVLEESSGLVCDAAGRPDWEINVTPPRTAKRIATALAVRTYLNFEQVVQSSVGPLSERVREEAAMALQLTEAEIADLGALPGAGSSGGSDFWVQPLAKEERVEGPIFMPEQNPYSDLIPYLEPGDHDAMTPVDES